MAQIRYKQHPRIPLPASLPCLHALLTPAVAHAFETLRIGVAILAPNEWHAIHVPPLMISSFELAHGLEAERDEYNARCTERVYREKASVLGRHAGFSDFFVPIVTNDTVHAVLITGPFATARPTSTDILERWRWLTGRQGHPSDAEFAHYVSTTLQVLLLEGEQVASYKRLLECFATLCAGRGDGDALAAELGALRSKLEQARFCDRMWEEARSMVDERSSRVWFSPHRINDLRELGLARVPEHVLVGLTLGRPDALDVVGEILKRDAFQRASVELARASRNIISGRVGDHGVMFLVAGAGSGARARRALVLLGERAATLARERFGLSLQLGTSSVTGSAPLSVRYEEALAAAENALSQGLSIVHAASGGPRDVSAIRKLRAHLGAAAEVRPKELIPRFERYLEAVLAHAGYRLDLAQAHLMAGFEQAAQALLTARALDPKSHEAMQQSLDKAARGASTLSELFAAYRRAVADLVDAVERPVSASRDRNLRRAIGFIHQHFTEPMTSRQVARIAGFAPGYFCQLFKRRERMTFEQYLRQLRVEHAKQLLVGTDLSAERVGQLSGFALRHYFHRVFRRAVGMTPIEFRESAR